MEERPASRVDHSCCLDCGKERAAHHEDASCCQVTAENAALRKRVEELEGEAQKWHTNYDDMFEACCVEIKLRQQAEVRAEKAEDHARHLEVCLTNTQRLQDEWRSRAERAERRVEELERSITAHHAAHVMRRQPGDVCPVCSPIVPLPQKYGDEIPKSLDLADLCQAAEARAEKAELELARAIPIWDEALKLARERAEKAEQELSETRLEWARSVDAAAAMRKGLHADLDAVLNTVEWLMSLADVPLGAGGRSGDRTRALLENRRQKRG